MVDRESGGQLTGRVDIDDAYHGDEIQGGKAGRRSPNKAPFVAAVRTIECGLWRAHVLVAATVTAQKGCCPFCGRERALAGTPPHPRQVQQPLPLGLPARPANWRLRTRLPNARRSATACAAFGPPSGVSRPPLAARWGTRFSWETQGLVDGWVLLVIVRPSKRSDPCVFHRKC